MRRSAKQLFWLLLSCSGGQHKNGSSPWGHNIGFIAAVLGLPACSPPVTHYDEAANLQLVLSSQPHSLQSTQYSTRANPQEMSTSSGAVHVYKLF